MYLGTGLRRATGVVERRSRGLRHGRRFFCRITGLRAGREGPGKRVLRLWVSKLKSTTDVSPRVVKSAYRLAVVFAEASQDNPLHLNKIVLAPERQETLLLALQPDSITLTVGCGFESMTTARGHQRN